MPKNDLIDRPLCDRRVLPTNLFPFGNVMRNSSEVRASINASRSKIDTIVKTTKMYVVLFIFPALNEIQYARAQSQNGWILKNYAPSRVNQTNQNLLIK